MDTASFLAHLRTLPWYKGQIAHLQAIPSRQAVHAPLQTPLASELEQALESRGFWPLYSHQAAAVDLVRKGGNVIVATPTASGKTLCYHVATLQAILEDKHSRAMSLFPTKALAQDQMRQFSALAQSIPQKPTCATYDGDTPRNERTEIRSSAQVVLTNPDMLHMGILPNHRMWSKFLRRLKYVILDEAHIYKGVFGSHIASVIRRLRRLCDHYGGHPQFILCSATIANPGEHADALVGLPCEVVSEDGSPYGGKDFALWDPPLIDEGKSTRRSANTEATLLFAELLKKQVRTIAFSRTRRLAELVYIYVRDRLAESDRALANRVQPYRAGYTPEDRRRIERDLFEGRLLGVSATNALELGIDIGNLDATILGGYPGSIASAWQQAGRSGRRGERSLSVMIASDNPLDQYLVRHPEAFFGKPQERAVISPTNPYVLEPHLMCAAYELPLSKTDQRFFGPDMWPLVKQLEAEQAIRERAGRWFPMPGVRYPAEDVNIRSTSSASYAIIEQESGAVLETVDSARAFFQVHPGAVYLHQGESYVVTDLDIQARVAYAKVLTEPYYTVTKDFTDIRILKVYSKKMAGAVDVCLGQVDVSNTVVSYVRKRQFTEEVLDEQALDLPTQSFVTVALWFDIPAEAMKKIDKEKLDLAGGLHAAEHAAIGMLPLFALCDRADIGGVSTPLHPDTGQPQVFIYDGHPGGVGIAETGYAVIEQLWRATLNAIKECPCEAGCPSCIQSPKCGNNNDPLDKEAGRIVLEKCLWK